MNIIRKSTEVYKPNQVFQKETKNAINSGHLKYEKENDLHNNKTNKNQIKAIKEIKIKFEKNENDLPNPGKIENELKKAIKEKIEKINIEKEKKIEKYRKNEKIYLSREIAFTVEKYGREIFTCIKDNESKFLLPMNFMDRHQLTPAARERMVDWMIEVFSVYKCDPGTFELAVHIMDCFILKSKKIIHDEDIHLIGLTCIYISSKVEDIIPLRMSHIVKSVGHSIFNENTIMKKEREIVKAIDFDFFTAGTYDYLMTFFYDLKVNNAKKINEFKGIKIIEKYLNFSILLSQLLLYSCEFVCYRQSLNSLAILALAFDILKTNLKDLNKDLKNFLSDWVFYVINEMGFNSGAISIIYSKIFNLYQKKIILPQKFKEKNKGKNINEEDEFEIINLVKFNQDKFI